MNKTTEFSHILTTYCEFSVMVTEMKGHTIFFLRTGHSKTYLDMAQYGICTCVYIYMFVHYIYTRISHVLSYHCIESSHEKCRDYLNGMFWHNHHVINLITLPFHKMSNQEKISIVLCQCKCLSLAWDIFFSDIKSQCIFESMLADWVRFAGVLYLFEGGQFLNVEDGIDPPA